MELIMQCARVREQPKQTMQHFLAGLNYNIRRIVRHHQYFDMIDLLHQARAVELQLVDDAKFACRSSMNRGHFTLWTAPSVEPTHNPTAGFCGNASSKTDLMVSNAKKLSQPAASAAGSSNSMPRNRDMNCHTCGG
jgi:hypothetical protein